jgi:hypothetical protein
MRGAALEFVLRPFLRQLEKRESENLKTTG